MFFTWDGAATMTTRRKSLDNFRNANDTPCITRNYIMRARAAPVADARAAAEAPHVSSAGLRLLEMLVRLRFRDASAGKEFDAVENAVLLPHHAGDFGSGPERTPG